jgi:hypothetical protein
VGAARDAIAPLLVHARDDSALLWVEEAQNEIKHGMYWEADVCVGEIVGYVQHAIF